MPWTPSSLFSAGQSGGWFDFSDTTGMWQNSAGTIPVTASGQPLGKITPKVGSGNVGFSLTQPTSTARPTYTVASGQGYIQFDGADWLDSGVSRFGNAGLFAASTESWSIYAVAQAGNCTIVARCSATASLKTFQFLSYPSSSNYSFAARGGTITDFDLQSTDLSPMVGGIRWSGSTLKCRIRNDIRDRTSAVGTAAQESGQRIVVGARTNGTAHYMANTNKIWQLFIIDRELTDTEEENLMFFMASKAGVTGVGTEGSDPGVSCSAAVTQSVQTASIASGIRVSNTSSTTQQQSVSVSGNLAYSTSLVSSQNQTSSSSSVSTITSTLAGSKSQTSSLGSYQLLQTSSVTIQSAQQSSIAAQAVGTTAFSSVQQAQDSDISSSLAISTSLVGSDTQSASLQSGIRVQTTLVSSKSQSSSASSTFSVSLSATTAQPAQQVAILGAAATSENTLATSQAQAAVASSTLQIATSFSSSKTQSVGSLASVRAPCTAQSSQSQHTASQAALSMVAGALVTSQAQSLSVITTLRIICSLVASGQAQVSSLAANILAGAINIIEKSVCWISERYSCKYFTKKRHVNHWVVTNE